MIAPAGKTVATHKEDEIVVALHDALGQLALVDQRKAEAVELRFFGGMSHQEIAEFCSTSVPTVVRDLRMAEAWLRREIGPEAATLERCQDLALTAIRTDGAGSRRAASIKA